VRLDFENKMKLAQTTLSRRDSLKIARRFNAGNGSPCASSPAGARLANESQRDSGLQPKVARHALPWVNVAQNFSNPNGVAAFRWPTVTQPRWGCEGFSRLTQGSWRNPGLMDAIPLGLTEENSAERGSVTRSNIRIFQADNNSSKTFCLAKRLRVTDPRSVNGSRINFPTARAAGVN